MAKDHRKIKITTIAMKAESVRGTYETLAAANTYCVQNATLPTVTPNILELDCSNGTMTPADGTVLVGDQEATMSFDIAFPISTTDASTYATNYSFIWNAIGFSCADSTNVTITPADASASSLSASYNIDGWEYRIRGCVASECKISAITKEAVFMNVTLIGTISDRLEATPLVATSAIALTPEMCVGLTLSIIESGTSYKSLCTSAVLTIINKVKAIQSVTATKGIAYHAIVERDSRIMLDCSTFWESTNQSDDEIYGFFEASTKVQVSILNSASILLDCKGKITAFDQKDSDGSLHTDLEVKATGTITDLYLIVYDTPAA